MQVSQFVGTALLILVLNLQRSSPSQAVNKPVAYKAEIVTLDAKYLAGAPTYTTHDRALATARSFRALKITHTHTY